MKKEFHAIIKCLIALCFTFIIFACATTGDAPLKAANTFEIIETDERMFWEIHGMSEDGTPSTVYVLGTIHLGDERMYPLSDYTVAAFEYADRLVAELSSDDINKAVSELGKEVMDGLNLTRNLYDSFNEQEIEYLYSNYSQEILESFSIFEPWVLTTIILEQAMVDSGLSSEYGLDTNLYAYALEMGRSVEGIESLDTQMSLISFGDFTYDEQVTIVKEMIQESMLEDQSDVLQVMYTAYLEDDKDILSDIVNEPLGGSELEQRYIKILLEDRNKNWADKIVTYLNEGGTTFIYAGAGHFTGENTVFDFLSVYQ